MGSLRLYDSYFVILSNSNKLMSTANSGIHTGVQSISDGETITVSIAIYYDEVNISVEASCSRNTITHL